MEAPTHTQEEEEHVYPAVAEEVCDTPQIALGTSGQTDKYGFCRKCGYHSTCHEY